jgi:hypothetical protein
MAIPPKDPFKLWIDVTFLDGVAQRFRLCVPCPESSHPRIVNVHGENYLKFDRWVSHDDESRDKSMVNCMIRTSQLIGWEIITTDFDPSFGEPCDHPKVFDVDLSIFS